MNLPIREGISLNLSFLQISDVFVILLVLILSFFNVLPSLKIKNKWLQAGVYSDRVGTGSSSPLTF
jgi:hypothetical protein